MRTLLVTTANEAYVPLLRGLVGSLQQLNPLPYTALACFDLGLSASSRAWIEHYAAHVVTPDWDLPVAAQLREKQPELRALTVRPFLPRYFPGYDVYLWIDTDTWVQERFALEWYIEGASRGALAATPQVHHAYRQTVTGLNWRMQRMHTYFGKEAAQRLMWETYVNAGVFALPAGAPHWTIWAKHFNAGLKASNGMLCCDQTALNYAMWTHQLPFQPLTALCNWLCHLALPRFDASTQRLCEPAIPGQPIGIVHLLADTKDVTIEVGTEGGSRKMSLRFPGGKPTV